MPLSEHEQRILEDIERRLQEEDPRLADAVSRASVTALVSRRVRLGALAFLAGFVMLLLFLVSVWIAFVGFAVMLGSALFVYQQLRRYGGGELGEAGEGRFSIAGILARLTERFRGQQPGRH